jgi:serine/threonine protein kinase/formylglycine-generating enzyme required for sulfatase activity
MRVRCPHCHSPLEIVADECTTEIVCPSCGSNLDGINETLVSIRPDVKFIGRFQLVERVGRGYFGEVWKARDTDLRRLVAVKMPRTEDLTEDTRERFLREAKTTAQLRHPNIVPVHEVGREGKTLFIVSDFIDGMTLAERIAINRPDPHAAANLCATLALALHYAHESGVIHRDLKPSNIMLDQSDKPYLFDFGLAKQEAGEFTMTASGDVLGTPAYMPLEQARGDSHRADRRSDIYSMGVILYELLTGERPFKGSTHLLIKAILNTEPSPPSKINRQLPRDLETICLKAMSKEPHRRYATALEFANDLQRFLNGQSIQARRATPVERGWRWMKRNPVVSAACAIAILSVSGLIGTLSSKSHVVAVTKPPPRRVRLDTVPTGATLAFIPLSSRNGEPLFEYAIRPTQTSPTTVDLAPGDYLVSAVSPQGGYIFHEVYRRVPGHNGLPYSHAHLRWDISSDGIVLLPEIRLPLATVTEVMARFEGADEFKVGDEALDYAPPHARQVEAFLMDRTEVTVGQIQKLMKDQNWPASPMPFDAMGEVALANPENPVVVASFDDAIALAEHLGKRIPTEFEYEFAATQSGTTRYPWGDDPQVMTEWEFGPVTTTAPWDATQTQPSVRGLYSNILEWTLNMAMPYPTDKTAGLERDRFSDERIVRGGTRSLLAGDSKPVEWLSGPRTRVVTHRETFSPRIGFRGTRSLRPR